MPPSPGTPLVAALHQLVASLDDRPDEDLLVLFTTGRDEAAFATIVRRHGDLVFDVCLSVLRNRADAEDAFQATFLALATQAGTIRTASALAGWLHGTACQVVRKALRARRRRRA
jgi:DNA-directed RNA polymerase specialized sigma24 family protein